jgi:predicted Zn-dependent peptidase
MLACFALFDNDPSRINDLEAHFNSVTPDLIERTAREYLRPTNRTVLVWEAGAKASTGGLQ